MKKTLTVLTIVMCLTTSVSAVVVQKVTLKNGTVLNGYIQQQDKNENITFRSENAIVCISGKDATTTERVYNINELHGNWIDWAEKNDAFNGVGSARTLSLNEVLFGNIRENDSVAVKNSSNFESDFKKMHSRIQGVRVLEKGSTIKYLELTPNVYTFNWKDVESIKADKRQKTDLSGVDITYQLNNGQEVNGQYAGESYNTLSLYTKSGMIETFDINDVVKYLYKRINPDQTIFEQSELVDVVRTRSMGNFRGIIVERNYVDGNKYLVIQQQSGGSQMIKFADVLDYCKEENPDYNPKTDIVLKKGEVVINRTPTDSVGVKKNGTVLVLDSINGNIIVNKEGTETNVAVEFHNPQHRTGEHLILVKVDKSVDKKKRVSYHFSTDIYEMKKFSPVSIETSVNDITRITYSLPGTGVFAIYDQENRQAMPFIVK